MKTPRLVCIVVTFNRLEKLKNAISSYQSQTTSLDALIIVDNNSSDGTKEFLEKWRVKEEFFQKHVIFLPKNCGGSGGFHEGQKYAMTLNPDWIFVADDDAYPEPQMIEKFNLFLRDNHDSNISAVCTKVTFPDGKIQLGHRCIFKITPSFYFQIIPIEESLYLQESFSISIFSYVGTFINAAKIKDVGYVNPNLFIYADDGEHSLRLNKKGRIVCVPSMNIIHDSGADTDTRSSNYLVSWRDYYLHRNQINMLKKHHFLCCIRMCIEYIRYSKHKNIHYQKVIKNAVFDGLFNRLGVHKIYKPGWHIKI